MGYRRRNKKKRKIKDLVLFNIKDFYCISLYVIFVINNKAINIKN